MTSQPVSQAIAKDILHNISRSKNQTMTFGQLIEYNKRNIFSKNHAENETGRVVPVLLLFFKKVLYDVKASGLWLSSNIFR